MKPWMWITLVILVGFIVVRPIIGGLINPFGGPRRTVGTVTYRETLNFEINGKPFPVSGVYQIEYAFSLTDQGSGIRGNGFYGEAYPVDFGQYGKVYVLRQGFSIDRLAGICGIPYSGPSGRKRSEPYTRQDYVDDVTSFEGTCERTPDIWPKMVRFEDEEIPSSIEVVFPSELTEMTGGAVVLKSISVRRTDDPVTTGIVQSLPWLADPESVNWREMPVRRDPPLDYKEYFSKIWFVAKDEKK